MIAKLNDLTSQGFNELEGTDITWIDEDGILVIAKRKEGEEYRVSRAMDASNRFYGEREFRGGEKDAPLDSFTKVQDIKGLLLKLKDPRWIGVDDETRNLLFELARTPPNKDVRRLEEKAWEKVMSYGGELRERLELSYDMATVAQVIGDPERFTKYNPNAQLRSRLANL